MMMNQFNLLHYFVIFESILMIVADDYGRDITDDRQFGCDWSGGSKHGVICTCIPEAEEMLIEKNAISSYQTSSIEIRNCKRVKFSTESVIEMRNLRQIRLSHIDSLILEPSSLVWYGYREPNWNQQDDMSDLSVPSLKITIENSNITQLSAYTFGGRISSIVFDGVTVDNIEAFAFTSLINVDEVRIKNTQFKNIKLQSFKKFTSNFLELHNVTAELVPSRFISNISVTKMFAITNCNFNTLRPGAFVVYNPEKFQVMNTHVHQMDGEAFKVTTRGDVFFVNNQFHTVNDKAFNGIQLNKQEVAYNPTFVFDSNKFNVLSHDALAINDDFHVKFSNLYINESCDCRDIEHKLKESEYYSEIKCRVEQGFITVKEFRNSECSILESYSTVIVIVGVVLTLCIIIGTTLIVYYRRTYLSKKYGNEKMAKNKGNMSIIVPDGRTYRETEVHVIVERADLLTTDL